MKILSRKLKRLCRAKNMTLHQLLDEAGVSRNAYYTLARKTTVLPKSVIAIADRLEVKPSAFLEDEGPAVVKARKLLSDVEEIKKRHRTVERDNIRHTLLLLQEKPLDRLRRALIRAQTQKTDF